MISTQEKAIFDDFNETIPVLGAKKSSFETSTRHRFWAVKSVLGISKHLMDMKNNI